MTTIQYVINAVNNASRTFNDIANSAAKMDAAITAGQSAAERLNKTLANQKAIAAADAEAIDQVATAAAVMAAAEKSAAAALVDTARNAAYLSKTFGLVSEQSRAVISSQAQLTAMNKSLAESFGNVRSQAAYAALSESKMADMTAGIFARLSVAQQLEARSAAQAAEANANLGLTLAITAERAQQAARSEALLAAASTAASLTMEKPPPIFGGGGGGRGGGGGGFGRRGPWWMGGLSLVGVHNLMVLMGAQIIADTAGFIAFGIAATSTLSDVVNGMATLETSYQTLDGAQKVAALSLNHFQQSLRNTNEIGVVTVFREGLAILSSEMGHAGGITQQATQAFMQFGAMLRQTLGSSAFRSAFGGLTSNVRTDMVALFSLLNNVLGLVPVLIKDFNGLGLSIIHAVSGGIGLIGKLGTVLGGVTLKAAALGFSMFKAFSWLDTKTGFTSILARVAGVDKLGVSAGMIGLGVGALAAEFYWLSKLPSAAQAANNSLAQQIHLNQDSATSWYSLAAAERAWAVSQSKIVYGIKGPSGGALGAGGFNPGPTTAPGGVLPMGRLGSIQGLSAANAAQGRAIAAQDAANARTVAANYAYLAQTYGMTANQARIAMNAIGTPMTQALTGSSSAAQRSRFILQQYVGTVQGAASPTSALAVDMMLLKQDAGNLAKQVQDLNAAFSQQLTPFANTIQATVTLKQGNLALVQALKASHNQVGYNTIQQQTSASALSAAITNTLSLSSAILQQTGSYQKSMGPLQQEVKFLESLHSKSALVTTAIHLLENAINALKSKSITITANFVEHLVGPFAASAFSGVNLTPTILGGHGPGHPLLASGGMLRGGIAGKDSILMMGMPGEVVVPTHMVQAGAVDHLRGKLPGFGAGGMVYDRGYGPAGGGGGPVTSWGSGDTALLQSILTELRRLNAQTQSAPTQIGASVASGLNGTARPARVGGYYDTRSSRG